MKTKERIQAGDIVKVKAPVRRFDEYWAYQDMDCEGSPSHFKEWEDRPDPAINWRGRFQVLGGRRNGGVFVAPVENDIERLARVLTFKPKPEIEPVFSSRDNLKLIKRPKQKAA